VDVSQEDITHIVTDIWTTMLGLEVKARTVPVREVDGGRQVSASVQVTGEWEGAVAINCPESIGRKVAAAMFGVEEGQASEADVHDAIGEVTNMTAGNVKGLVSGYSRLSLPTVMEGTRLSISMPGSRVVRRATFDCGLDAFSVIVLEKA
jgi:chemotaxis protein CheX